ncbi:MAG: S-methyl-5-thioribose-1-phosphate isomerase [Clostridia bacterium]|nr:S-methyl-5-thioribose-1-phosphate isomerase [Clostridia bacterium]
MMDTLWLNEENDSLVIIDQTKLPNTLETLEITTPNALYDAIKTLAVRGAPAIGVSAAIGMYAIAKRFETTDITEFKARFSETSEYINSSRPTAVNLSWALERMKNVLKGCTTVDEARSSLKRECIAIRDEDIAVCRKIGENGASLITNGGVYITHCNAGRLAAVRYGTALAPFYVAQEQGKRFTVHADETRPLLQGARLTAYELSSAGIDTVVQCDNMVASLMSEKKINGIFVGCDRVARNGDAANKIGTHGLALIAKHFGVPFYVCAPYSTIDLNTKCGADIVIEHRDGDEIGEKWYNAKMTPNGVSYYNPAFDVTPHELITAFVTEKGVLTPRQL